MIRRPPRSTLFPYTTLFRSLLPRHRGVGVVTGALGELLLLRALEDDALEVGAQARDVQDSEGVPELALVDGHDGGAAVPLLVQRSEEHTSELQSRQYLVCRL